MKIVQKSNNGANISYSEIQRTVSFFKKCPVKISNLVQIKKGQWLNSQRLKHLSTELLQENQQLSLLTDQRDGWELIDVDDCDSSCVYSCFYQVAGRK